MSCSKCGGYDSCHCDLIAMKEELRIKELECYVLRDIIRIKEEGMGIRKKRLKFPEDCVARDTCVTVCKGVAGLSCSNNIGRCINEDKRDASYST